MHRKTLLMLLLAADILLSACGTYQSLEIIGQSTETEQSTTIIVTTPVSTKEIETTVSAEAVTTTEPAASQISAITETTVFSETTSTFAVSTVFTSASLSAASAASASSITSASTTASATATSAEIAEPPSADDAWMLVLVNDSHPLTDLTPPELVTLSNGNTVDARMYPALQAMFDAMRAKGLSPFVREGFRTNEMQQNILDSRIQQYMNQGYSQEKARSLALQYVAEPGTSEHQLGLAVDINSTDGNNWPCYNWLAAHAQEYGFILRYPQGKENITGIAYEPWHYRYVGEKAAAEIYAAGVTLEEYLGE